MSVPVSKGKCESYCPSKVVNKVHQRSPFTLSKWDSSTKMLPPQTFTFAQYLTVDHQNKRWPPISGLVFTSAPVRLIITSSDWLGLACPTWLVIIIIYAIKDQLSWSKLPLVPAGGFETWVQEYIVYPASTRRTPWQTWRFIISSSSSNASSSASSKHEICTQPNLSSTKTGLWPNQESILQVS